MSWSPGGPGERKKGRLRGFMLTEVAWKQSLIDHQKRMGKIKPTIQFDKNAPATGPGKLGGGGSLKHRPAAPSSSRPGTARSAGGRSAGGGSRPATAGRSPRGPQHGGDQGGVAGPPPGHLAMAQEDFGIHSLTPEQQSICKKMMKLLVGLENQQQSKKIVEEVFVNAEESRLLQGYTGVLPGMERPDTTAPEEEEEDEEEQQQIEEERRREEKEAEARRQRKKDRKQKEEEEKRQKQEQDEKEKEQSRRSSGGKSSAGSSAPPAAEKKEPKAAPENYEDDQDFEH